MKRKILIESIVYVFLILIMLGLVAISIVDIVTIDLLHIIPDLIASSSVGYIMYSIVPEFFDSIEERQCKVLPNNYRSGLIKRIIDRQDKLYEQAKNKKALSKG